MSETHATPRVALVTGASRGIGRAIAATLAAQGFLVIGTATTEAGAQAIGAALAAHGGQGLALDVNALSHWRLLELFAEEVAKREAPGEVWVNTSEAEIQPALSPLYEISKRLWGQLFSLRALDLASNTSGSQAGPALRLRRLVLGPFRSELNPYGVLSADWVAREILRQADWNCNLIIVSINPLTYVLMPLATMSRWAYFRWLTRGASKPL